MGVKNNSLLESSSLSKELIGTPYPNEVLKFIHGQLGVDNEVEYEKVDASIDSIKWKSGLNYFILIGRNNTVVLNIYSDNSVDLWWRRTDIDGKKLPHWTTESGNLNPMWGLAEVITGGITRIIRLQDKWALATVKQKKDFRAASKKLLPKNTYTLSQEVIKKIKPVLSKLLLQSEETISNMVTYAVQKENYAKARVLLEYLGQIQNYINEVQDDIAEKKFRAMISYALKDTTQYIRYEKPDLVNLLHKDTYSDLDSIGVTTIANNIMLGNGRILGLFLDFFRQRLLSLASINDLSYTDYREVNESILKEAHKVAKELDTVSDKSQILKDLAKKLDLSVNAPYRVFGPDDLGLQRYAKAIIVGKNGILLYDMQSRDKARLLQYSLDGKFISDTKSSDFINLKHTSLPYFSKYFGSTIGEVEKIIVFWYENPSHRASAVHRDYKKDEHFLQTALKDPTNAMVYALQWFNDKLRPMLPKLLQNVKNEVKGMLLHTLKRKSYVRASYLASYADFLGREIENINYVSSLPKDDVLRVPLPDSATTVKKPLQLAILDAVEYVYGTAHSSSFLKFLSDIINGNVKHVSLVLAFYKQRLLSTLHDISRDDDDPYIPEP